jgi:predicted flap endonuclease-1-like 5' DNA nuclease
MNFNFLNDPKAFVIFLTVLFVLTILHLFFYLSRTFRYSNNQIANLRAKVQAPKLAKEVKASLPAKTDKKADLVNELYENNKIVTQTQVKSNTNVQVNTPTVQAQKADNLQKVEGIGPAIEEVLKQNGILTYKSLSQSSPEFLKSILNSKGSRFIMHDTSSWPKQATLLVEGKLQELAEYQEQLNKR